MESVRHTLIPIRPEEAREQSSAMAAVALLVVATFSCALGSSLGFFLRAIAFH